MFRQKLQYLVKWEGYGIEGNTWEYSENLAHAPEKVTEFHTRNRECKAGLTRDLSRATNKPDRVYTGLYVGYNVVVLPSSTVEPKYK